MDAPKADDSEVCKTLWVWTRLNQAVRRNTANHSWRFVDTHVVDATGHGWCVSPRDSLRLPVATYRDGAWVWAPTHPSTFNPYQEDLGRWFRTTNDSVRGQYANRKRMMEGTIHPTFNMHIAYADAVNAATAED